MNTRHVVSFLLSTSVALSLAATPFPGTPGALQSVLGDRAMGRAGSCHKVSHRLSTSSKFQLTVPQPTGPIETTLCDFETVEGVNNKLFGQLADLVKTPFFKYFKVRIRTSASLLYPWDSHSFVLG